VVSEGTYSIPFQLKAYRIVPAMKTDGGGGNRIDSNSPMGFCCHLEEGLDKKKWG